MISYKSTTSDFILTVPITIFRKRYHDHLKSTLRTLGRNSMIPIQSSVLKGNICMFLRLGFFSISMWNQELELMILVGPLQLRILHDSLISMALSTVHERSLVQNAGVQDTREVFPLPLVAYEFCRREHVHWKNSSKSK